MVEVKETEGAEGIDDSVTPRVTADGESIVDLAQQPIVVAWVKFVTVLFAFAAVGIGLYEILSDAVGESIFDVATMNTALGEVYLAVFAAVFVGAFLGWRLNADDTTTFLAAGLSAFAATAVLLVLTALFFTIAHDISLDVGGLLVNAVLAGLAAAIAADGGVWAMRNLAPSTFEDSTSAGESAAPSPSDA